MAESSLLAVEKIKGKYYAIFIGGKVQTDAAFLDAHYPGWRDLLR